MFRFLHSNAGGWLAGTILLACISSTAGDARSQTEPALQRLSVRLNGHTFAVWARIPAAPRSAVLLLHGRTWSSLPAFDLHVPGLQRSALVSLAARGIAAYALDQRGYGETPRDATGWITPVQASKDALAALTWIAGRHPALPQPVLLGWSLGAATAHLAAASSPQSVSGLILYGYAPDPEAEIAEAAAANEPARGRNTVTAAAGDFISPGVTEPAVIKVFSETAVKTDPVHADWKNETQFLCDSSKIKVPTLIVYGERDPNVDTRSARDFFHFLAAKEKRLIVLPGADHCAHLEATHDDWIAAIVGFISRLSRPGR